MPIASTTKEFEVEPQSSSIAPGQPTTSSLDGTPSQGVSANPSLILAFLALSFFTMAMVFIFGFRKYQYLQEQFFSANHHRQSQLQTPLEEVVVLRELSKPQLWDVCIEASVRWWKVKLIQREDSEVDKLWSWRNIMPLSVSNEFGSNESSPEKRPCRLMSSGTHRNWNPFRQRFWGFGTHTGLLMDKKLGGLETVERSSATSRLRVAVLVAMPSEKCPVYDRGLPGGGPRELHERAMLSYEIGLYEMTHVS